jgi:imidazolonepropionase-like amidohydrolase
MITAFVDGPVFIGDGRVLESAAVLVENDRIVRVAGTKSAIPKEARKVSLQGSTLLPGFIDCHVHLCTDASADPMGSLAAQSPPATTILAAQFARDTLLSGITTVRDMGGKDGIDIAVRNAIRSGIIPGPRMLVSNRLICMTGGHGWQFGEQADGPHEVRKVVRKQIREGADLVKLMATGGVMTQGVEPGSEQFTEEELRAGIEEAHKAGRRTATHAMGAMGILNAVRAGIDSVEHGVFLNEEAARLMREKGIFLIPTLSALHHIETGGLKAGIPPFMVEKTLRLKSAHLESIRLAKEMGIRVGMGTDAGTPFNRHGVNLMELKLLVEAGYSAAKALESATGVAAAALGLENEIGTVSEGKLADLVVVKGNPLDDIDILLEPDSLQMVMQGGKFVEMPKIHDF